MTVRRWRDFTPPKLSPSTDRGRLSMRFVHPGMESAFLATRWPRLLRSVRLCIPVPIVAYIISMSTTALVGGLAREGYSNDEAYFFSVLEFYLDCGVLAMLILFLLLTKCRCFVERENAFSLELLFTSVLLVLMGVLPLSAPHTLCRIAGMDPAEVWNYPDYYSSDSTFLLKIDCIITAAHLGPPLRWIFLAPLEVMAVGLFCLNVFVIGSPEPMGQSTYNFILLTALVVSASVAKRISEFSERDTFTDIIQEKTRRCEVEYKLDQMCNHSSTAERSEATGTVCASRSLRTAHHDERESSVPSAAVSAAVFDPMYEKDIDPSLQLHRIAEMGDAEHWRVQSSELQVLSEHVIGSGSFGVVVKAIFSGMVVAVKCPRDRLDPSNLQRLPELSNELRILRHLRHPNIITIHGAIVDPSSQQIALVLEFVHGVTLDVFMGAGSRSPEGLGQEPPPPSQRYQVMIGVCLALLYMHTRTPHIVHGDLKSANIMVEARDGYVHAKLLDFGLSRIVTRSPRPLGGTLVWVAPEVLRHKGVVKCSADVYSCGRLLGFLATGIRPLLGMQAKQIRWFLKQDILPFPVWPRGCVFKEQLRPLVHACLRVDPSRRPTMTQIHERLVSVPEELFMDEDNRSAFLENIRLLKQQACQEGRAPPRGPGPGGACQRPSEAIALGLQLEQVLLSQVQLSAGKQLSSVPEANEPTAGATTAQARAAQTRTQQERIDEECSVLIYPHKLPTEPKAMAVSLVELITSWNFRVTEQPCCVLHGGARVCQLLCGQLLNRPCFWQELDIGGQCLNCGMLGLDVNTQDCQVCRSQPALPLSPGASHRLDVARRRSRRVQAL